MVALLALIKEILELQVTMDNAVAMDVVQRQQHLPDGVGGVALGEPLLLHDAVKELAALHTLHDKVEVLLTFIHVVKPSDMRVVHAEEDLHLGLQLGPLVVGHHGELELLDGELLRAAGGAAPARRHAHHAVVAGAEDLVHDLVVVLDSLRRLVVAPRDGHPADAGLQPVRDVLEVAALVAHRGGGTGLCPKGTARNPCALCHVAAHPHPEEA
mmetsp:Transcript_54195/g.158237  ORF Transcript_54195/g.158237 Transcript_54195/m.158237 type:complete len:213 (+) Transcript_54195:1247-1885(+)